MSNSSIWPIHRTLLGDTTLGQSEPVSDGNEGVLRIPKSSSITGALSSYCLVSYARHSLWGRILTSTEELSVYLLFYSPSQLGLPSGCYTIFNCTITFSHNKCFNSQLQRYLWLSNLRSMSANWVARSSFGVSNHTRMKQST